MKSQNRPDLGGEFEHAVQSSFNHFILEIYQRLNQLPELCHLATSNDGQQFYGTITFLPTIWGMQFLRAPPMFLMIISFSKRMQKGNMSKKMPARTGIEDSFRPSRAATCSV